MAEEETTNLKSLKDFISGLYQIGGIPLTIIGLGAGNLLIPNSEYYTATDQIIVSLILFMTGLSAWVLSTYIALKRWEISMKIAAEQDREMIKNVCELLKNSDSAVFQNKLKELREFMDVLSTRQVKDPPVK